MFIENNTQQLLTEADLTTLSKNIVNRTGFDLNCVRVGILDELYSNQTAKIILAEQKILRYQQNGVPVTGNYTPIFAKVCYANPYETYPLTKGEECILLFNDRETETWHITGQANYRRHDRMHDFSDCFAIFGIRSIPKLIEILTDCIHRFYGNSHVKIYSNNITVDTNKLTLNGNAEVDHIDVKDGATGNIVDSNGKICAKVENGIVTEIY